MCKECYNLENYIPSRVSTKAKSWEPTKTCTKCKKSKSTQVDFGLISPSSKGKKYAKRRASYCRACHSKISSTAYSKAYHTDLKVRAKELCRTTRTRALKKGIDHNLTTEWLLERLEQGVCQATGLAFVMEGGKVNGGHRSFTPSLDRTDPNKGYTQDNTKVVCWIYNAAKGVGTHEDVMKLVEALANV